MERGLHNFLHRAAGIIILVLAADTARNSIIAAAVFCNCLSEAVGNIVASFTWSTKAAAQAAHFINVKFDH
jgi:hypothetical protein